MRIFHVCPRSGWIAALRTGEYVAVEPSAEGYLAAAPHHLVAPLLARWSEIDEPVVVLEIETELLETAWEEVPGDTATPVHVLGPIDTRAVVDVRRASPGLWDKRGHSPMAPPEVNVFGGLAVVLGVPAIVLLIAVGFAHLKVHPSRDAFGDPRVPTLPPAVEFLLWSSFAACAAAALAAWVVAIALRADYRRRTAWRP